MGLLAADLYYRGWSPEIGDIWTQMTEQLCLIQHTLVEWQNSVKGTIVLRGQGDTTLNVDMENTKVDEAKTVFATFKYTADVFRALAETHSQENEGKKIDTTEVIEKIAMQAHPDSVRKALFNAAAEVFPRSAVQQDSASLRASNFQLLKDLVSQQDLYDVFWTPFVKRCSEHCFGGTWPDGYLSRIQIDTQDQAKMIGTAYAEAEKCWETLLPNIGRLPLSSPKSALSTSDHLGLESTDLFKKVNTAFELSSISTAGNSSGRFTSSARTDVSYNIALASENPPASQSRLFIECLSAFNALMKEGSSRPGDMTGEATVAGLDSAILSLLDVSAVSVASTLQMQLTGVAEREPARR